MNLTLKIAHETKKTNRLYYTRDDPDIFMSENSTKIYFLLDLIRQSNLTFK